MGGAEGTPRDWAPSSATVTSTLQAAAPRIPSDPGASGKDRRQLFLLRDCFRWEGCLVFADFVLMGSHVVLIRLIESLF